MKTIEIEDDVYEHLLQNTIQIGETASQILKRLLGIPGHITEEPIKGSKTVLSECLNSPTFKAKRTMIDKFLYILSFVHKRDPEQFEKVLAISGWSRKYFALSSKELKESGRSVYPRQIPDSQFWVITNTDTRKKRRMMQEVLKLLGYSNEDVKQVVEALRDNY
jgi:negative modulator of initiation of replication